MAADPVVAPRPRPHAPTRRRLRPAPPPRRRVSGPAPGARRARPAPAPPLGALVDRLRTVGDSRLLDRLIRGQAWVVVLGIALMGIVALQVSLLKLNTGIGQSIERAGALERQNAGLRAEVSTLSNEERIQAVAEEQGMLMPPAGEVRYVKVRRGDADAAKAAAVMRPPDPPEDAATTSAATTSPVTPTDPAATGATTTPEEQPATTAPPAEPQPTEPTEPTEPTTGAPPPATSGATATDAGAAAAPTASAPTQP
jgi:cell division protein FtsL